MLQSLSLALKRAVSHDLANDSTKQDVEAVAVAQ